VLNKGGFKAHAEASAVTSSSPIIPSLKEIETMAQSTPGDGFQPHPALERFSHTLEPEGLFYFDSGPAREAVRPGRCCSDQDLLKLGQDAGPSAGSSVLLIHGNGDEADTWRHVLPTLAQNHRVLALDLPGFGRSKPRSNGNFLELVSAVSEFIGSLGLERTHLVGSSLGAAIAGSVASQSPEQISSLTLVGGVPSGFGLDHTPQVGPLLQPGVGESLYTALREAGQDAAYATLEPYYASLENLPQGDREFLRGRVWARVWSDTQRSAFFAALRSLENAPPVQPSRLEALPILLVWGEQDRIWPLGAALEVVRHLPGARLERIGNTGHLPHQEQPQAFLKVLEEFLSG